VGEIRAILENIGRNFANKLLLAMPCMANNCRVSEAPQPLQRRFIVARLISEGLAPTRWRVQLRMERYGLSQPAGEGSVRGWERARLDPPGCSAKPSRRRMDSMVVEASSLLIAVRILTGPASGGPVMHQADWW